MGCSQETAARSLPPSTMSSPPSPPALPLRRHSHQGPSASTPRPLRSSPLAGNSLHISSDGRISEFGPIDSSSPMASRTSSTPDLPSLNFTSMKLPKRISTTSSSAFTTFGSSLPSPPPSPSRRPKSRDSYMSGPMPEQHFGPEFPRAYTGARSLPTSPNISQTNLLDTPSSWLTSSPYGSTPKFSRLSLDSKNVIMPVSARDRRRMSTIPVPSRASTSQMEASGRFSQVKKRTSLSSLISTASVSSLPALPPSITPSMRSIPSIRSYASSQSISSLPALPSSNPPSIRTAPSVRSIRTSSSLHSLRSITSYRTRPSHSTTPSECDVIAELQDEFGVLGDDSNTESPSPGESLSTSFLPSQGETDPEAEGIMYCPVKAPRRISSLPKIKTLLKRARSQSLGSTTNASQHISPHSSEPHLLASPVNPGIYFLPRSQTVADVPTDITPISAIFPDFPTPPSYRAPATIVEADPVEEAGVDEPNLRPQLGHKKGASFLSFSSSDDHHEFVPPEEIIVQPPPPPVSVSHRKKPVAPPPDIPIPLPPTPVAAAPRSLRIQPPPPKANRRRTLTPSSPTSSESSAHLLTPSNATPITSHYATLSRPNSKAMHPLGLENDDTMSLSPPASPIEHRPMSWASGPEASLRSSASFTSIPGVRPTTRTKRSPSTLGPRSKAMSLLGIGDLPPSGAVMNTGGPPFTPSLSPPVPMRAHSHSNASEKGSVRKFFSAFKLRKSAV